MVKQFQKKSMRLKSPDFESSHSKEWRNSTLLSRASLVDRDRPCFLPSGHLPPGMHEISIEGLASLVRFNKRRSSMWPRLCEFLLWPAQTNDFSWAYLGGGFLSSRPDPDDIDLILQTKDSYGADSFRAIEPFFSSGLEQIQDIYGVHLHFWMEEAPEAICDFRAFFQYDRSERPAMKLDFALGIVKLDLTAPKSFLSLQGFADGKQQVGRY